ncbi:MAG: hypothetical protein J0L82_10125 [Deltaproteobacteria bacterium]|jgi:hypothetical protein|nr:hypothetical protein [Deltaproteobacteria bacterium]
MKLVLILGICVLTGCATTNRGKTLQAMAAAGIAGALHGASRPEAKNQNAALYGGIAAAGAGVFGLYHWDSETEAERLRNEAVSAMDELERLRAPKRIVESPATFGAKIPDKYRSLIQPGAWRVSEIDQWVEDGENRLIHQDLIMELIPPSLNPNRTKGASQ